MNILALETSGHGGEVALLADERVIGAVTLDPAQRSAQSLAPAMAELLRQCQLTPRDVQLVAITVGPGSFTGLRIGVTAAKTFAYAVGAQCLAVDTLEVIAAQVPTVLAEAHATLWTVIDAQRHQLFATRFQWQNASWQNELSDQTIDNEAFLEQLTPGTLVSGSGLKKLLPQLPHGVVAVEQAFWQPRADTVGRLAWRDYSSGRRNDFWRLTPKYLRPSAAEEKHASG